MSGTTLGVASDALTYSEYGELATHVASISGTAIFTQDFTRDALGRVSSLQETIDGATHTYGYTYDLADRLATVTIDSAPASSYTYDANGNATATTVRGVAATGSYDAQDRVTAYGGATFDWTAQGELLAKHLGGSATSYVTDSLGRLQSVTLPTGHVVSYVYDGSNRRVGKKIDGVLQQGFLYRDAIKPAVELDGAGTVVSRFVYGSNPITPDYVIRGGNTYRIFTDQTGSPRVVVDVSSGSIVERIDYDERGNTLNDTNAGFIPFGFAGGIVDRDTGLVRFGARDYDPSTGRWNDKEPLGFRGSENFYQYSKGDPVNWFDADGFVPCPRGSRPPVDYTFFSGSFVVIPFLPLAINPQITQDRYGHEYIGIGAGYNVGGSSIAYGDGRLHPFSPCPPTEAELNSYLTGNSLNYNLGVAVESGTGVSFGGSTSLSPGNATGAEVAATFGEPGVSANLSWQHTWQLK